VLRERPNGGHVVSSGRELERVEWRPGDPGEPAPAGPYGEVAAHLWAGGGITWSSDPAAEVEEVHAKAGPVLAALGHPQRQS